MPCNNPLKTTDTLSRFIFSFRGSIPELTKIASCLLISILVTFYRFFSLRAVKFFKTLNRRKTEIKSLFGARFIANLSIFERPTARKRDDSSGIVSIKTLAIKFQDQTPLSVSAETKRRRMFTARGRPFRIPHVNGKSSPASHTCAM